MEFVIVSRLASVAFVVCGIYALQNGFIKVGEWQIDSRIIKKLNTNISTSKDKKKEKNDCSRTTL
jgi:hypothetical protein